jgi:hypothetical protein
VPTTAHAIGQHDALGAPVGVTHSKRAGHAGGHAEMHARFSAVMGSAGMGAHISIAPHGPIASHGRTHAPLRHTSGAMHIASELHARPWLEGKMSAISAHAALVPVAVQRPSAHIDPAGHVSPPPGTSVHTRRQSVPLQTPGVPGGHIPAPMQRGEQYEPA